MCSKLKMELEKLEDVECRTVHNFFFDRDGVMHPVRNGPVSEQELLDKVMSTVSKINKIEEKGYRLFDEVYSTLSKFHEKMMFPRRTIQQTSVVQIAQKIPDVGNTTPEIMFNNTIQVSIDKKQVVIVDKDQKQTMGQTMKLPHDMHPCEVQLDKLDEKIITDFLEGPRRHSTLKDKLVSPDSLKDFKVGKRLRTVTPQAATIIESKTLNKTQKGKKRGTSKSSAIGKKKSCTVDHKRKSVRSRLQNQKQGILDSIIQPTSLRDIFDIKHQEAHIRPCYVKLDRVANEVLKRYKIPI